MILWSAIALKDALVTFLIVVSVSSCVSLKRKVTLSSVLGTILPIAAMQPVRFYMVYFVAFSVVMSLAIDTGSRVYSALYKQFFVATALGGLFIIAGIYGGSMESADHFSNLRTVAMYRAGMAATAKSGYGLDADTSTVQGAVTFLPIGMANLLLAPFPWQMVSLRPLIAAPETIAWWILVPATLRGLFFTVRRRFSKASPLLLFTASLTTAYAISQGNVGAAFRQRAQIFVFLFIFTAVGWWQPKCRRAGMDERLLLEDERPDLIPERESPPAGAPPIATSSAR
jgi:hypothetical protein